jgi:hypothetical protein
MVRGALLEKLPIIRYSHSSAPFRTRSRSSSAGDTSGNTGVTAPDMCERRCKSSRNDAPWTRKCRRTLHAPYSKQDKVHHFNLLAPWHTNSFDFAPGAVSRERIDGRKLSLPASVRLPVQRRRTPRRYAGALSESGAYFHRTEWGKKWRE